MNATGKRRLLKLADFLSKLPKQKFDFTLFGDERGKPMLDALAAGKTACGTVGCAIGWAPAVFPRSLRWLRSRNRGNTAVDVGFCDVRTKRDSFKTAARFFSLTSEEVRYVFSPFEGPLPETATPKRVAQHIRRFVKRGGMPA